MLWFRISHEFDANGDAVITLDEFFDGLIYEAYLSRPPKQKRNFGSFQAEFDHIFADLNEAILEKVQELYGVVTNTEYMVAAGS